MEKLYRLFKQSAGICTDTRNIIPNSIFFALKGERFDANNFIDEAINKGVLHVVCTDTKYSSNPKCTVVADTLLSLQQLAAFHRDNLKIPVIGVTGTNGKTTTKELISCVLSSKYKIFATKGNFNNSIGVPLSILSISDDCEMAIIEMGASHPGDIAELVAVAKPTYGLITNVGKAHILGFGSFEGVKSTKAELYDYIKQHRGTIFQNIENENLTSMLGAYDRIVTYGVNAGMVEGHLNANSDFLQVAWKNHNEIDFMVVQTNLTGAYNLENVLAAATIGSFFNIDSAAISNALASYKPTNSRSQILETENNKILLDAYNANPSSMSVSIDNFSKLSGDNKSLIIGSMGELGSISSSEHKLILDKLVGLQFTDVYLVGGEFLKFADSYTMFKFFDKTESLLPVITKNRPKGRFFMIKGSRSNKLEQILPLL